MSERRIGAGMRR